MRSPVRDGSLKALRGDAVALPAQLADDLGIAVGDRVGLMLGDGAHVRVRVVALLGGPSRYAALVLPPALLAAHTSNGASRLLINGDGDVRQRIERALGGSGDVTVRGDAALADDLDTGLRVDRWITFAVVGVIVAYAAMSLFNLIIAALGGRRRELALLRLAGATSQQVARMLRAEALLVAVMGAIAGTTVAITGLIPLAVATAGSPLPSGSPAVFLAILALATLLILLPTMVGTRLALRRSPATEVERP